MSGLPGSGKSTKAEELIKEYGGTIRINKDLLRTMMHFDKFTHHNEDLTIKAARNMARFFLLTGTNVIIDDTNLNPKTLQSWKDLAKEVGDVMCSKIEYHHLDTPPEVCVDRDLFRAKKVGKSVIFKMALQFQNYMTGQKVIICDLDGTICDITHRLQYGKGETKDWDIFFSLIPEDLPRTDIIQQVMLMSHDHNAEVIFVSARPETHRQATEKWLADHNVLGKMLIMREANDKRPDTEVKSDIYDKYLKNLDIVGVFDDRPSVIRMWREKGLNVIDVGQGIEF